MQGVAALDLSSAARKSLVRAYRCQVVSPALCSYDDCAFREVAAKACWPYPDFQRRVAAFDDSLLLADWSTAQSEEYRTWAVARCTGRLPLPTVGASSLPTSLLQCPLCEAESADLEHFLCHCPALYHMRVRFGLSIGSWHDLRSIVFSGAEVLSQDGKTAIRIRFVREVFVVVAARLQELLAVDQLIANAAALAAPVVKC